MKVQTLLSVSATLVLLLTTTVICFLSCSTSTVNAEAPTGFHNHIVLVKKDERPTVVRDQDWVQRLKFGKGKTEQMVLHNDDDYEYDAQDDDDVDVDDDELMSEFNIVEALFGYLTGSPRGLSDDEDYDRHYDDVDLADSEQLIGLSELAERLKQVLQHLFTGGGIRKDKEIKDGDNDNNDNNDDEVMSENDLRGKFQKIVQGVFTGTKLRKSLKLRKVGMIHDGDDDEMMMISESDDFWDELKKFGSRLLTGKSIRKDLLVADGVMSENAFAEKLADFWKRFFNGPIRMEKSLLSEYVNYDDLMRRDLLRSKVDWQALLGERASTKVDRFLLSDDDADDDDDDVELSTEQQVNWDHISSGMRKALSFAEKVKSVEHLLLTKSESRHLDHMIDRLKEGYEVVRLVQTMEDNDDEDVLSDLALFDFLKEKVWNKLKRKGVEDMVLHGESIVG